MITNPINQIPKEQLKRIKILSGEMTKSILPFQNHFAEIARQVSDMMRPTQIIVEQMKLIQDQNKELLESVANITSQWSPWINLNKQIFDDIARKLKEFEKEYDIAEEEVVKCLKKYKWFVTPSMSIPFIFEAYKVAKKRGNQRGAINDLYYELVLLDSEFLDYLLENWKGKIDKLRYKSLVDIFKVIKNAPKTVNIANVVVPTLIVIVDGLIGDFLKENNLSTDGYQKRKQGIRSSGKVTMNPRVDALARDVLLEILFQKAEMDKPLENPYQFNRHRILHGENTRYGRTEYMIRLILIIDYLVHLK